MKTFDDAEAFIDFINHHPEDMLFDHAFLEILTIVKSVN